MTKKELASERKRKNEELAQLQKESMDLVIKRSGVSKKTIIEGALKRFFVDNIDLLTPDELKKYRAVIL